MLLTDLTKGKVFEPLDYEQTVHGHCTHEILILSNDCIECEQCKREWKYNEHRKYKPNNETYAEV